MNLIESNINKSTTLYSTQIRYSVLLFLFKYVNIIIHEKKWKKTEKYKSRKTD